jgi:hypothetical protein
MAGAPLTDVSTFSASVVAPIDGDFVTGASVTVGEQALANRTRALYDGKFASVTASRVVSGPWHVFDHSTDAPTFINYAPNVAVADYAHVYLTLPHGSTINSFTISVDPGAHASLPAVMPSIVLFRITAATGQIDNTGGGPWGGQDTSATPTIYNAVHDITFNVGITVDRTACFYLMRFTQESGANSTAGLLFSARVNVTTAQQDPVGIV